MDHEHLDCDDARTSMSARLDGEEPLVDAGSLDVHLAGCAACRAWEERTRALHRRTRVASAPEVPDLVGRVLAATAAPVAPDAVEPDRFLRLALALVGLVQIAVAAPALLLGEDAGLPAHTARHLGSFAVALGVGFLVAAWRPDRAGGVLPVVGALALCIVVTATLDLAAGRAAAGNEAAHTTELVGLAGVWLLARTARARPEVRVA